MKKTIIILIALIFCVINCGCSAHTSIAEGCTIRIQVRADSNVANANNAKLLVANAVVQYLSSNTNATHSLHNFSDEQTALKAVADKVLMENGESYKSIVKVSWQNVNTIIQSSATLLVEIVLGRGKGEIWWQETWVKSSGKVQFDSRFF